jgi:hypothetical protein
MMPMSSQGGSPFHGGFPGRHRHESSYNEWSSMSPAKSPTRRHAHPPIHARTTRSPLHHSNSNDAALFSSWYPSRSVTPGPSSAGPSHDVTIEASSSQLQLPMLPDENLNPFDKSDV